VRYPHADTNVKLTLLVFHTMEMGGRKQAETLLKNAQIGKEKMTSVLHNAEMLLRYRSFYAGGRYVARPRALPHFLTALGKGMDAFRQMVRMINVDRIESEVLPCECLYSGERKSVRGGDRSRRGSAQREAVSRPLKSVSAAQAEAAQRGENMTTAAPTTTSARKHKRNVQRRLQRKRAKARKKSAAQ
jgi:hypothetical protein